MTDLAIFGNPEPTPGHELLAQTCHPTDCNDVIKQHGRHGWLPIIVIRDDCLDDEPEDQTHILFKRPIGVTHDPIR